MCKNTPICSLTNLPFAHILYIFNEREKYLDNAVSFIFEGLLKNEVVLFVETKETFNKVKEELESHGIQRVNFKHLIFADSTQTYINGDQFDLSKTIGLVNQLKPYFEEGYPIRTWGQVLLPEHDSTLERLRIFEFNSNNFITEGNIISVCAYNGLTLPAYIQNELMRTHTHFMTDNDYNFSPLYNRDHIQLPSIEEKERLLRLERQNKELRAKNYQLEYEKSMVKHENKIIVQSEQKFRSIIDQLPIPVIIRKNSSILFYNEYAKEQFSFTNGFISEDSNLRQFFEKYDSDFILLNEQKIQEHSFILSNGIKKYYLVKSTNMIFEGEPSIFHSFVDITQEKENEKLTVRSEKMNIVGELAASIAHEIRNPLTSIKGFFKLLKGKTVAKELYYQVIEEELSRIEQISSELLSLAKPHTDNRQQYNIIQLMEEVKLLLTSESNIKSIEVILQSTSEEIYIYCEVNKIKQVFINMIKNAIEAMEDGGRIILYLDKVLDTVEIQVIDQGKGIPKEVMSKLGEPFYTTKEKGTGLGLMVCYQIIESHEGSITIDSEQGIGTTFTISLPVLKEANLSKVPIL